MRELAFDSSSGKSRQGIVTLLVAMPVSVERCIIPHYQASGLGFLVIFNCLIVLLSLSISFNNGLGMHVISIR